MDRMQLGTDRRPTDNETDRRLEIRHLARVLREYRD